MTLDEYRGRVAMTVARGVLGGADDADALTALLAGCGTVAEVDAAVRTARRWEYATEPLPPWVDWREELELTRN
jgi:hypothetical protein